MSIFSKFLSSFNKIFKKRRSKRRVHIKRRKRPSSRAGKKRLRPARKRVSRKRTVKAKTAGKKVPKQKKLQAKRRPVKAKKSAKPVSKPKVAVPKAKNKQPAGDLIGEVTHYFSKIQVIVLKVTKSSILIGDQIAITGKSATFNQRVTSLQIESKDVKMGRKGDLVGLKVIKPAKVGDKVFKIK